MYSATVPTACLFTSAMMSPRAKPRSSPKVAGSTSITRTPFCPSMPARDARSGVRFSTRSPNSAPPSSFCESLCRDAELGNTRVRSSTTALVSLAWRSRTYPIFTLLPIGAWAIGFTRSFPVFIGWPLTLVITSPPFRPAFSAGLPGSTPMITTPLAAPSSFSVIALVPSSSWKLTPIEPRVTRPC